MFIIGDVASQGVFDLCDLISVVNLHLKREGYVESNVSSQNCFIETCDLNH